MNACKLDFNLLTTVFKISTKMNIPWLTISSSLQDGIKVINSTDPVKFPLLLTRIFHAVQNNIDVPFSQEELQKLEKSLKLSDTQIRAMLDSLLYITKRSEYFLLKPTVLQEELIETLQFNSDKAEIFVKLWTENLKLNFDNFQDRSKLQNFSWELNLEAATDNNMKTTNPVGLLQLQLKDNEEKSKNITIEMNEEQLLDLYNQIEHIQSTLDSINK